jgi:hypothetical protein
MVSILTKMGWATFWAIFSQAHLVTLILTTKQFQIMSTLTYSCEFQDFCDDKKSKVYNKTEKSSYWLLMPWRRDLHA